MDAFKIISIIAVALILILIVSIIIWHRTTDRTKDEFELNSYSVNLSLFPSVQLDYTKKDNASAGSAT